MRFLKIFFSRFFYVFIAIILQVLVLCATTFWLASYYRWVNYAFSVIAIIVFLVILNKNRPASFKLPWIAIILILPIFGITLYGAFGNYNLSKKNRKKLEEETKELKSYCLVNEDAFEQLKNTNENAYGQARYIENTINLPVYKDCYIEYLSTGEEFHAKLLEELSKAKKYIFMEYFIVEYGTMLDSIHEILLKKAKEGVEIYFMYDDVGSISKVRNGFFYDLRNEGINACKFLPFKPLVSVIHNNRDHRKITVIDGEVGFTGGINIADEYVNIKHPFGVWKDNAVLVKGKCVDSLIFMFIKLYNSSALKKIDPSKYLNNKHEIYENKSFISLYGDGPSPTYQYYVGKNVYLNIINQAVKYLYITTPYLIMDYEFFEAIINASKRGVDVKIITPHIPDKKVIYIMTKSNYQNLIKEGVGIYEYKPGFIHAKMFVCDDKIATVGTINLDYRSTVHHFECGAWIYNDDSILLMKQDFENIIKNDSVEINDKNGKLKVHERILKDILRMIAPLM